MKPTLTEVQKPSAGRAGRWAVEVNGKIVGLLEKYTDTRTEKHPWKAFAGIGTACTYLRSYYPNEGGKKAAIQAVLDCTK